jgi:hypothetical protein
MTHAKGITKRLRTMGKDKGDVFLEENKRNQLRLNGTVTKVQKHKEMNINNEEKGG